MLNECKGQCSGWYIEISSIGVNVVKILLYCLKIVNSFFKQEFHNKVWEETVDWPDWLRDRGDVEMGGWDSTDQKVHTFLPFGPFKLNHYLVLLGLCFLIKALFFCFSYWDSGEPNGEESENCGQIFNYNLENSWNDESCSSSVYWICVMKVRP